MEDIKMLDSKYHVDCRTGFLMRYVKSTTEYFRPHYHNYYEIFLMVKGKCKHKIGDSVHVLNEGYLLFIRDFDVHDYACAEEEEFHFLNLSFERDTLYGMLRYLGEGFDAQRLLQAKEPPCVILPPRERSRLFSSMIDLNTIADKKTAKTRMRALLLDIFMSYFQNYSEKKSEIPLWLEITYEKMRRPENFSQGMERMVQISGKSREHLGRSMQKYYQTTPTAYLSELRLTYAVNLMRSSNLSVTDICFECGFSNLSWFYKLFEREYGMTPAKFKKNFR